MALWLGMIDLVLIVILVRMNRTQMRTIVPIFEKEQMLRDAAHQPGSPFLWLGGSWYLAIHYSIALAMVYLLPSRWIERKTYNVSRISCTKDEFLQHFSPSEVRRAVLFHALGFTFLAVGIAGYSLMPPEAR